MAFSFFHRFLLSSPRPFTALTLHSGYSSCSNSLLDNVVSDAYRQRIEQVAAPKDNQEDVECPVVNIVENRNPRNLEQLGIARKQLGWPLHHPRKDYWHKLNFVRANRNTSANIVHCSGAVVLSASTNEAALWRYLDSATDVAAASLVGAVLSDRCRAAGITCLHFNADEYEDVERSRRLGAFLNEFRDNGIALEEPPSRAHEIEDELLGVDYDAKEGDEAEQIRQQTRRRAQAAQAAESLRKRVDCATEPANIKVLPDGRAVSSRTGRVIHPKVPSANDLAFEAEMERRRRSVYMVTPPTASKKPVSTNIVYAE